MQLSPTSSQDDFYRAGMRSVAALEMRRRARGKVRTVQFDTSPASFAVRPVRPTTNDGGGGGPGVPPVPPTPPQPSYGFQDEGDATGFPPPRVPRPLPIIEPVRPGVTRLPTFVFTTPRKPTPRKITVSFPGRFPPAKGGVRVNMGPAVAFSNVGGVTYTIPFGGGTSTATW